MHPYFEYITSTIDKISQWTGTVVSYLVYVLVGVLIYEVIFRYLFNSPTVWAFDMTYMLYGTIFMIGNAYTLLEKCHIRTDIFYHKFSLRKKAKIDALMYFFLFFPGMIFYLIASWECAAHSWAMGERSSMSAWMPIIYPLKAMMPLSVLLLLLQGISEFIKSIYMWKKEE